MASLRLVPPRKKTVVEGILEQLIAAIRDTALKPGDKLPSERELIDMLGVSRSSVREALQALSAMDLIESRPGHGTFIKKLKPHFSLDLDIESLSGALQVEMHRHLNQARLVLETGIVELAAAHINPDRREAICRALETYEAGAAEVSEKNGWPGHNDIHLAIAETSGNPILVQMLQSQLALIPRSLRIRTLLRGGTDAIAERIGAEAHIHRRLCEAVMRGDGADAVAWMRRHAEHEEQLIAAYTTMEPEEKQP